MDFGRSVAVVDLFSYSVMRQMRELLRKTGKQKNKESSGERITERILND